jgi:hypothetical protein
MECMDCPLKYTRQTGQTIHNRYKEQIQAIRNNNGNSGYSNHVLNTGLAYGSITDIMKVVKIEKKRNTSAHSRNIYIMSKNRLHMNDIYIDVYSPIFEVLKELNTR